MDRRGRARPTEAGDRLDRTRVREVVQGVLEPAGYDLEELAVSRAGRRHVVRVIVDSDRGVNLDAVAELSRSISSALDAAEESGGALTPGEYTLEVSSPGIDRPLTVPRHWRRNVGRLVRVRTGERTVTGRVLAAGADGVELDVAGSRFAVGYGDLGPGRVQVDFSRVAELPDEPDTEDEEGEDAE